MDNNKERIDQDILTMANEMTYYSYNMRKLSGQKLFSRMTATDYVALEKLIDSVELEDDKKLYLQDIADTLKLPIGRVSRLVRTLRDRGLVVWTHDGNGDEGTYIQLTEKGANFAKEQQEKLRDFYTDIIEKFGRDRFKELLKQLYELEKIMSEDKN